MESKLRECLASAVRMCLFCGVGGVLAVTAKSQNDIIISVAFILFSCNEFYYLFMVIMDYKRASKPKSKSRKKKPNNDYAHRRLVIVVVAEALASVLLWIAYKEGVVLDGIMVAIFYLVVTIISFII